MEVQQQQIEMSDDELSDTSANDGNDNYNELLQQYCAVFERNKHLQAEVMNMDNELVRLLSVNEQKDKDSTEKEMEIGILKREKDEMVKKSQDMEKMLQEEIDEHDKLKRMGERERIELNEKNREMEEKLFMKETTLKQELEKNIINKENIEHIEKLHKKDKQTEQQLLQEKHQSIQNEHVEEINELSGRLEDSEKRLEEKEYDMKEKDNTIKELEDLLKRLKEEEGSSKELLVTIKTKDEQLKEASGKVLVIEEKEDLKERVMTQGEKIYELMLMINEKDKRLKEVEGELSMRAEKEEMLNENLNYFMDENVKIRNANKVKSGKETIQQEFEELESHIIQELSAMKRKIEEDIHLTPTTNRHTSSPKSHKTNKPAHSENNIKQDKQQHEQDGQQQQRQQQQEELQQQQLQQHKLQQQQKQQELKQQQQQQQQQKQEEERIQQQQQQQQQVQQQQKQLEQQQRQQLQEQKQQQHEQQQQLLQQQKQEREIQMRQEDNTVRYDWEKYSRGAARRSIEMMGYTGGGLGKNGTGIVDALSTQKPKETLVFSSSITKGITVNGFNKGYSKGNAKFKRFPGAKASEIKTYIPTHLEDRDVYAAVIVGGGNDLSDGCANVVESIIEAGNICRGYGVDNIFISSILPRSSSYYQAKRKKCNDELKIRCTENGFTFIDNSNMVLYDHVSRDGVHLNRSGSSLVCRNILKCLNKESFNDLPL